MVGPTAFTGSTARAAGRRADLGAACLDGRQAPQAGAAGEGPQEAPCSGGAAGQGAQRCAPASFGEPRSIMCAHSLTGCCAATYTLKPAEAPRAGAAQPTSGRSTAQADAAPSLAQTLGVPGRMAAVLQQVAGGTPSCQTGSRQRHGILASRRPGPTASQAAAVRVQHLAAGPSGNTAEPATPTGHVVGNGALAGPQQQQQQWAVGGNPSPRTPVTEDDAAVCDAGAAAVNASVSPALQGPRKRWYTAPVALSSPAASVHLSLDLSEADEDLM